MKYKQLPLFAFLYMYMAVELVVCASLIEYVQIVQESKMRLMDLRKCAAPQNKVGIYVGPSSATLYQHQASIVWICSVFLNIIKLYSSFLKHCILMYAAFFGCRSFVFMKKYQYFQRRIAIQLLLYSPQIHNICCCYLLHTITFGDKHHRVYH